MQNVQAYRDQGRYDNMFVVAEYAHAQFAQFHFRNTQ